MHFKYLILYFLLKYTCSILYTITFLMCNLFIAIYLSKLARCNLATLAKARALVLNEPQCKIIVKFEFQS